LLTAKSYHGEERIVKACGKALTSGLSDILDDLNEDLYVAALLTVG